MASRATRLNPGPLGDAPMKLPRSSSPRFPTSSEEADVVYKRWDRLNGRYYYIADVLLESGEALVVTFDGDTNIAVEIGGLPVPSELFATAISGYHVR